MPPFLRRLRRREFPHPAWVRSWTASPSSRSTLVGLDGAHIRLLAPCVQNSPLRQVPYQIFFFFPSFQTSLHVLMGRGFGLPASMFWVQHAFNTPRSAHGPTV